MLSEFLIHKRVEGGLSLTEGGPLLGASTTGVMIICECVAELGCGL